MNRSNWISKLALMMALGIMSAADVFAQAPTDDTISFWVVEAMREDPRVKFSGIRVATREGIVTLTGSVVSLAESNFARLVALKIQGVRGVINQLTVLPGNRSDADITLDVRRRILQSSSIRVTALVVRVNAGEVNLSGTVGSLAQFHQASLVVSEVRGVRAIKNEMRIELADRRSDMEISKDIEAAMRRDVYLNTLPINISVQAGVVDLEGTVGNAYQKERATQEARRVANVVAVNNRLSVEWWRQRGVRGEMPRPSDSELKSSVYSELDQDLRIDASDILVDASGGHVTLRGTVRTFQQKQIAEQDAMGVAGTMWVSNLLGVRDQWREDREVTNDVIFGFSSDYLLRNHSIQVRVIDGVVTLSGFANSANEKVHAAELAGRVRGVRAINNKIEVLWTSKFHDAALEDRIRTQLKANWETRWVADDIDVKVQNGKVTLSGTVKRWSEWREASRVAYMTEGVWMVENHLAVAKVEYEWERWYSESPPVYFDDYPDYRFHFFERRF